MKKNTTDLIENIFIFLLVLLILPFPRIVEDILILVTLTISLLSCLCCRKKNSNIMKIYADNLPYLIISMMLLQIHTIRFSLVATELEEQLFFVQIVQWMTTKLKSSEAIVFCTLIYQWLLLYFMIVFTDIEVNKIVVVNEHFKYETLKLEKIKILQGKENAENEISVSNLLKKSKYEEEFCFILSKINKYIIAGFVISIVQIACGIAKDILFNHKTFESCFFNNAVITIGSCIPFVINYLLMIRFVFVYYRRRESV